MALACLLPGLQHVGDLCLQLHIVFRSCQGSAVIYSTNDANMHEYMLMIAEAQQLEPPLAQRS